MPVTTMQTNRVTHLEDLSNEIFIEILDYLHATETFSAFGSLNSRISSILHSIRLQVCITQEDCSRHVKLLSSYLWNHSHQVISLWIDDGTADRSSAIDFLFKRHRFVNLRSCVLRTPFTLFTLPNVLEQLESLTNLQRISVCRSASLSHQVEEQSWSRSILTRMRSTELRLVCLNYYYDHSSTLNMANPITSNLTHLDITFCGPKQHVSIYSTFRVLRSCPHLQTLYLIIINVADSTLNPVM